LRGGFEAGLDGECMAHAGDADERGVNAVVVEPVA
jgi:hypothetical protein